jgi:hypothetical protein
MGRNYTSRVQHVAEGSPVSASNTSRPTRQLEDRSNFLREQLDSIEEQRLLLYPSQTVEPDAEVGQAVFWNDQTKQFERALAGVEPDPVSGALVPLASADCLGMIVRKINSTLADIATIGVAQFDSLAAAIDGSVLPGRYYLSAETPGKITRQKPAVSIPVCHVMGPQNDCDETIWALLLPQPRDFLEEHVHYRFDLVCHPAGDTLPPTPGVCHQIFNPNVAHAGWLPADHASFNGHAPRGASFGYNLAAHPALQKLWPPIPLESVALFWDKGDGTLKGATEIPTRGIAPLAIIDRYGIWWMSCCYGDVPWPLHLDTLNESSASMTSASFPDDTDDCPRTDVMRLILAYTTMLFATDKSVVTSLEPAAGEPITFLNCDNEPAKTGALRAKLDLAATIDSAEYFGGQVIKKLVGPGFKFGMGYVAEGLVAGNDNISLSSTRQRRLTPGDTGTPLVHQGIVTVSVDLDPGEKELPPQIIKLNDTLQREYKEIVYLGFPTGRDSNLRMSFNVPSSGLPTSPKFKLRAWMFGRGAVGPFSAITAGYYRIVLPTIGSPTVINEGDTPLTFNVVAPSTGLAADSIILVESAEFAVVAGDTVMLQLTRLANASPVYANDIGLVRVAGIIIPGG